MYCKNVMIASKKYNTLVIHVQYEHVQKPEIEIEFNLNFTGVTQLIWRLLTNLNMKRDLYEIILRYISGMPYTKELDEVSAF